MTIFVCVCCFNCNKFQVVKENKKRKFSCAICGEKQSIKKVFAQSFAAKDVRKIVQELNSMKITPSSHCYKNNDDLTIDTKNQIKESYWHKYLDSPKIKEDISSDNDESGYITTLLPLKKRKRNVISIDDNSKNDKSSKICKIKDVLVHKSSKNEIRKNIEIDEMKKKSKWNVYIDENDN